MERVFPIILMAFSVMMLLYAGLIALCGFDLIPKNHAVKVKDKKKYARCFAALIALLAWAPGIAGIIGLLFGNIPALIVLIAAFALFILLGRYIMRNSNE